MVTVNDVTQMMFRWAPPELAMDWDNVGLLVGRGDREVHAGTGGAGCVSGRSGRGSRDGRPT